MTNETILVVEDKKSERFLLDAHLKEWGFKTLLAANGIEALDLLKKSGVDLILSDMVMPEMDGMELLGKVKPKYGEIPFIMMTAHGSIEKAVTSVRAGAFNYIQKPLNFEDLRNMLRRELDFHRMHDENRKLKDHLRGLYSFQNIITKSPLMAKALKFAEKVSKNPRTSVAIYGESGTGKEVLARAIHFNGEGAENRFVAVNCAAVPASLLESELFGHVKGAFTGADENHEGKFDLAQKGTLLLDEIGDMPLDLQAKFLRVLQERVYEPLGSHKQIKADCRVIVATHQDLSKLVNEGRFREDLFHRVNAFPITLPPLRERKEDIPFLTDHFLSILRKELGKQLPGISQKAMDILVAYEWPGNIRELKNCIERAVIMNEDELIKPDHLVFLKSSVNKLQPSIALDTDNSDLFRVNIVLRREELSLDAIVDEILHAVLEQYDHNKSRAAEALKVDRRMFYRIKNKRLFTEYGDGI